MNDRYVAIAYRAVPLYYLNVEFELKFEVIFQSRVPHSQRGAIDLTNAKQIGFKLFHVGAEPISIFMQCEKLVDVWVKFLSKLINQFGFHELFKPLRKLGKGSTATVYEVERLTDG